MRIVEKTNHLGLAIEYVEFEPVNKPQVQQVRAEIDRRLAAINARQPVSPSTAAAAYARSAA
ncbi:MAG: hypothetical protein ACN6RA_14940 [Stenotrophomonas maltophilia]